MKQYYLFISIAMLLLAIAGLLVSVSIPGQVKQETSLVNYNQIGKFACSMYMKPSYLYGPEPQTPAPNPRYPLAAVGTIDFTYSVSPANKDPGSAYVEAVLENPGIWQKSLTLVPETTTGGDFTLSFSLDPDQINSLFSEIEKETAVTASPRSLVINVHISSGGSSLVQSLPLTLDKNLIEISSSLNLTSPEGTGKFDYTLERRALSAEPQSRPEAKYPAALVKSLDFSFSYRPADQQQTSASVEAVLENPDLWQKSLVLVPQTAVSGENPLHFTLDLDDLQKQFDDIDEQTGITTETRLVTLKAIVSGGSVSLVQALPLIIDKNVLEVSGDLEHSQPGGTGAFDYVVNLKPNTLFSTVTLRPPEPSTTPVSSGPADYEISRKPDPAPPASPATLLKPGQTAFTRLIDRADVTFSYLFQADQPVDALNTEVDINAVIEAPKSWTRTFPLLHTTRSGDFNVTVPVDIAGYIALLQSINSETGVTPESINISITASLHTTGKTKNGNINETFTPYLKGTISGGVLQWGQDLTTSQPGSVKTTAVIPNPQKYLGLSAGLVKVLGIVWAVIFFILCGFSALLYWRARPATISSKNKELLRIKKKYGVRLVEAVSQIPAESEKTVTVGSMEDLIKVADELAKPVIYRPPAKDSPQHVYFVIDGATRYQYLLESLQG